MRLQAVLLLLSLDLQAAAFQLTLRARFRAPSSLRRTSPAFPVQGYCKPDGAVVPGASPLRMAPAGGPEAGGSGKEVTQTKIPDNVSASAAVGSDVDGAVAEEAKDDVGHATTAAEGSKEDKGGESKGDGVGVELKALEKGQGDSGKEAGDVGTATPKAPSGVGIGSVPAENGDIFDESEFTELEKAFAEARRRSLAQGAKPKAKPAKPAAATKTSKPTVDSAAAAPVDKPPDADVASKPTIAAAAATSEAPPAKAKPSTSDTTESPAIKTPIASAAASAKPATEPSKEKAAPMPATAELPSSAKPAPEPEIATPPKSQAVESREPVPVKAKESKPESSEKAPSRAFSLAAESIEEFFGLNKKPRMISTTAPLSSPPSSVGEDPSGMPKLDKAAVDSMLEENGLNEVTLKENFRKMEAEARVKAAQVSDESTKEASEIPATPETSETMEPPATPFVNPFGFLATIFSPAPAPTTKKDSSLADASEQAPEADSRKAAETARPRVSAPTSPVVPEKEKKKEVKAAQVSDESPKGASEIPVTPETSETMEPPATPSVNPFGFIANIFSPSPAPTTKKDPALADASEKVPEVASGKTSEVTRPRVSATISPVVPQKEKEKEPEEQAAAGWGGLRDIFGDMFAEPVYDDEIDTLPKERSSAPRAMPVFAPPPAPAPKAPPLPEPSASKTKAKEKAAPAKSEAPTPRSFLDGMFGGGNKVAPPSPAPAPARAPPPAPAPAPVPAAAEQKSSATSLFDGLFGSGDKKEEKPSSRPKPVKSPSSPASSASVKKTAVVSKTKPAASPRVKSQGSPSGTPAASLFGLFGGGKSEENVEVAVKPKESTARASAAPAPAPAVPKAPAFNLFRTAPKAPAGKGKDTPAAPPASSKTVGSSTKKSPPSGGGGGGGMFDFLGGVAKTTAKSAPPAPTLPPPPQVVPKPSGGANPFAGLFGSAGGGSSSEKKKAAAAAEPKPKPKPKRQPLPAPPPAPAPMVSRVKTMDDAFLRKVSLMLKRNQTKIKKFQQLTDRFRGGLITASVYYDGVEGLFGEENVEEIIGPLLAALPENDKRRALQQVYNKAQKARGVPLGSASQQDAGGLAGGLAGLFGGWGASKSESPRAPSGLKKKDEAVAARGTGKGGGAADDPYAFAAAKLKDADYQLFVARTKLFTKGGINARNYYDTLAKLFGKEGVPKQLPAVLKTLPQNKRKVLQDVCNGLNKRS